MSGEGFLHRWSRLKRGGGVADPGREAGSETGRSPDTAAAAAHDARPVPPPVPPHGPPPKPGEDAGTPIPLPPIESLRPDSDFSPFMQAGVDPATRNAALARLFADPHFNTMDGLDVYIDDYGKTEPIPPAILRGLEQARTLGLFDKPGEGEATEATEAAGPTGSGGSAEAPDASAGASPAAGRDVCGAPPPAPGPTASAQQERENPET